MFPVILEVIISIVLIYFLLSTTVSFINEIFAMLLDRRGKLLNRALKEFCKDDKLIDSIYESNHIVKLSTFSKTKLPEYITSENFANAILENIKSQFPNVPINTLNNYETALKGKTNLSFIENKLIEIIDELNDQGNTTIVDLKIRIQDWYDKYMLSLTNVYKNQAQFIIGIISFVLVVFLNIDSLVLMEYFYENKDRRELMVNQAKIYQNDSAIVKIVNVNIINNDSTLKPDSIQNIINSKLDSTQYETLLHKKDSVLQIINSFDLPIGWKFDSTSNDCFIKDTFKYENSILKNNNETRWFYKLFGLLLTTICITLGAPYWYRVMVSLLSIRDKITK
jgi:hypothetical protein